MGLALNTETKTMNTADILDKGLHQLRQDIVNASIAANQRATGRTYEKITVENVSLTHGELWAPSYVSVLEDGRRPGKVPYDFERILQEWAEAKGLQFSSYYMLAKKIREEGTSLYRSGDKPDIFEGPLENFKRWLSEQLAEYYKVEITNLIRSWITN